MAGSIFFEHVFSVLSFVLTLVFVSLILRSKRPPGNTVGWLAFIFAVPYVGIPLFLFLSDRKFQTRLQKKKALYSPSAPVAGGESGAIEKILASDGVPPPRLHQNTRLLPSGEEAYSKIVEMIDSARSSIHLTTYIFADDDVGKSLIALLEKKAQSGVAVRILMDSFGNLLAKRSIFDSLRQKNGDVAYFNPVFHAPIGGRFNFRNHRKLLIVDSCRAILGGMNIAGEYMGPTPNPERWKDLCIAIEGTAAKDIQNIFREDWRFATGEDIADNTSAAGYDKGESNLQIIGSGPDVIGDTIYDTLISAIYQAAGRVWIATPYFIPDESLTKALELAAKRGVDVHLLIPLKSNHLLADLARGSYLRQLLKSGCHISLNRKMLHAKAVIVDEDFALLGSANFDMRSLLLNYEIAALQRSGDSMKALENWFEQSFRLAATSDFKVTYLRDLVEGVGRVLGPFI